VRTVSAKPRKGEERARGFLDDWILIVSIAKLGLNYVLVGRPIRRKFRELQRTGGKFYVDEAPSPRPRG
jgi:hypothetical protein